MSSPTTTAANGGQASPKPNPRVRLPDAVVRDKRLDAASLVWLAYRATFAGNYVSSTTTMRKRPIVRADKRGTGLGRDAIERVNRELRDAGYLRRWQPPSTGDRSFKRCIEKVTLPPCGKAGCIVERAWFDAQLSVKEMAAYLYFRAGTGRGSTTYAAELCERFGWSPPTAAKVVKALMDFGLLGRLSIRQRNGCFKGLGYQAFAPFLWRQQSEPVSKNQGTVFQGTRTQGTNESSPFYELPKKEVPFLLSNTRAEGGRYASLELRSSAQLRARMGGRS